MLDKAVSAVKSDEKKALTMFNKGQGGFKDRDLYVLCANASDGTITAKKPKGLCSEEEGDGDSRRGAGEREITYLWPRPGSITRLKKHTFYTRVGDQICGVGYWE